MSKQTQQLKKQAPELGGVPMAPYPPMISTRRYPSGLRSSLASSPQYSVNQSMKEPGNSTTGALKSTSERGAPQTKRADEPVAGLASSSSTHSSTHSGAANNTSRNLWSKIRFCSSNMVACINCEDTDATTATTSLMEQQQRGAAAYHGNNSTNVRIAGQKTPLKSNRRLGPVLLELRRLELVTKQQPEKFRLFSTTRVMSLSRGNPSLGTSVSSTCLDVAPVPEQQQHVLLGDATSHLPPPCATGLTTGALCIHTFHKQDYDENGYNYSGSIEYFHTPRHHRQAMAVSWRPRNSSHVALGLVGSSSGATPGGGIIGAPVVAAGTGSRGGSTVKGGGGVGGLRTISHGGGGDREFCCFLWDVEHQASSKRSAATGVAPLFKLSHNQGVASLAWLMNGQTLAVGGQYRNVQLYDLRVSGTSSATPPLSAFAHNLGVHGIHDDPHRPHQFATFSRAIGEPVKVWDARRMDSVVSEIKISSSSTTNTTNADQRYPPSPVRLATPGSNQAFSWVTSIQWSTLEAGTLSVAIGDTVHDYDILSSVSRPILLRVNRVRGSGPILDMALYPGHNNRLGSEQQPPSNNEASSGPPLAVPPPPAAISTSSSFASVPGAQPQSPFMGPDLQEQSENRLISELYTHRLLVVLGDRTIHDMAKHTIAPVAISRRDGRVIHAMGRTLWTGSTLQGPSAMESSFISPDEDISATMMRRARCLHIARHSTDIASNIKMLAHEISSSSVSGNDGLLRLWSWIDRMEALCFGTDNDVVVSPEESAGWPCKGLNDAGIWYLLQMNGGDMSNEKSTFSESLSCVFFEGLARSAALTSCGWAGKFDLSVVLSECEALGEYERSAALAVWHGDIGAAVDALQRGADYIHLHLVDKLSLDPSSSTQQQQQAAVSQQYKYAETLQLVSMCIAGYGGFNSESPAFHVWRKACTNLMQRAELSSATKGHLTSGTAYLRALCRFLVNIGIESGFEGILDDTSLSLCDRVAFACRFLQRADLKLYLAKSIKHCQLNGNIEGIVITGIEKQGIKILQSYVDRTSDVQTGALVTSRVVFPPNWTTERKICTEWLDSYRGLLNTWQMWQSRAMFDVDRADLLRRIKARQQSDGNAMAGGGGKHHGGNYHQSRRMPYGRRPGVRKPDPDIVPAFPAQLDARCTYCSSPLGLKRLENHANQWLSKMKPVLSCCPQCRKPLPRCSVCLLSLGCLNPYMELTRERARSSRGGGAASLHPPDDLSSLANLPFAEWFTWCMRCKHGGHAHHIIGWFANHESCPVSGCDCKCQFDGIQTLNRPGLSKQLVLDDGGASYDII